MQSDCGLLKITQNQAALQFRCLLIGQNIHRAAHQPTTEIKSLDPLNILFPLKGTSQLTKPIIICMIMCVLVAHLSQDCRSVPFSSLQLVYEVLTDFFLFFLN